MNSDSNPYAPPQAVDSPAPPSNITQNFGRVATFRSNSGLAFTAVLLLAGSALVDGVAILSTLLQVQLLNRGLGEGFTDEEAIANDGRQQLVGFAQLGMLFVTGIVFLTWMYRAHRNLPALQASEIKYSPGWAVGAWFVPILNLFRPYQIMQEIWRGSNPAMLNAGHYMRLVGGSSLVGWWWGLWIGLGVLGQIVFRLSMGASTIEELLLLSWADIASSVASLPCAMLAIAIVRGVDANQEERHLAISGAAPSGYA